MSTITSSEAAKAVVRRNTEGIQRKGRFDAFEALFAGDFVDYNAAKHDADKAGVRKLLDLYS
jgi:hypothetical protein